MTVKQKAARTSSIAVSAIFLAHGLLTGSWVPHIPLKKEELGLGTATFGWILLAMAVGGIVAMPLAGMMASRFGSATLCRAGGLLFAIALALPVFAETPLTFVLGLGLFGAMLGVLDVAMNTHGLGVEHHMKKALMSSFHGWYSIGAAAGAGLGGGMIEAFGRPAHVLIITVLTLALLGIAGKRLLPASMDRGSNVAHFAWPTSATMGLGALCFLALFIEGAMLDWSAIYLRQAMAAPAAMAGAGFSAFSAGMALTRFAGDKLRVRFGSVWLVGTSALALAFCLGVALASPFLLVSIIALGFAGLGIGNIVPVLFAGGGRADPDAKGRGIAAVTTMGYSGFLLGPPCIGMVAESAGLQLALGITVLAGLVIAAFARIARAADGFAQDRAI